MWVAILPDSGSPKVPRWQEFCARAIVGGTGDLDIAVALWNTVRVSAVGIKEGRWAHYALDPCHIAKRHKAAELGVTPSP